MPVTCPSQLDWPRPGGEPEPDWTDDLRASSSELLGSLSASFSPAEANIAAERSQAANKATVWCFILSVVPLALKVQLVA